jgi:polysaccharide export outer membrane protein
MKITWKTAVAALIVTMMSGMAFTQNAPAEPAANAMSSSATDKAAPDKAIPAAPASVGGPEYVIGPDDSLHIAVWKEADLSATLPVRPDGKISLPLLNDVQAAGLTPQQLADSLTEKLKKYIADPRVTVVIAAINSKHIYLVGEVLHTGATPLMPNMTVLQALSSAGINQFAKTKGIYILRTENGKQQKLGVNYRKLIKGEEIDHNYQLQPGDTIVVP